MRILRINNNIVDIDEKTSIGINFQCYDITDPTKRKTTHSNSFSLPLSSLNSKLFDYSDNTQSISTFLYEKLKVDYFIDNVQQVFNANAKIDEITDRIYLSFVQKSDIWDYLKQISFTQFESDIFEYIKNHLTDFVIDEDTGLPYLPEATAANIPAFVNYNNGHFTVPAVASNPLYVPHTNNPHTIYEIFNNSRNQICIGHTASPDETATKSGHVFIFVKSIFQYLESLTDFNINFGTSNTFTGNVWDDAIIQKVKIPFRNIEIVPIMDGVTFLGYGFAFANEIDFPLQFEPYTVKEADGKTAFDFINAFLLHFNIMIDSIPAEISSDGKNDYLMYRFDDINTLADVMDWTGLTGQIKYKPTIEGTAIDNYIKFSDIYENGSVFTNSKKITGANKTLDATKDLITISSYVPDILFSNTGRDIFNIGREEAFKVWSFFVDDEQLSIYYVYHSKDYADAETGSVLLYSLNLVDLTTEYETLKSILEEPKTFTVTKWLTINDLRDLRFFKLYYFRELNCTCFINKISGFNPEKALQPTTLELIKVNKKTPPIIPVGAYFVDGVDNPFVDGSDNKFV